MAAARCLPPAGTLRPVTYETIFGLITATGLRISEAMHLRCGDIDLEQALLTVRKTKFCKSRHVPPHATTVSALRRYLEVRTRHGDTAWMLPCFYQRGDASFQHKWFITPFRSFARDRPGSTVVRTPRSTISAYLYLPARLALA
jgi:integrase